MEVVKMKLHACPQCGVVISLDTVHSKKGGVAVLNEKARVVKCPVCAELVYEAKDGVPDKK
jgi:hypothetical protein